MMPQTIAASEVHRLSGAAMRAKARPGRRQDRGRIPAKDGRSAISRPHSRAAEMIGDWWQAARCRF